MTPQHEPPSAWVIKQRMATVQVENSLKVGEALPTLCKNMDLSQTQIDSLIGARQIFNKKIDSIRERRTSILERINEVFPEQPPFNFLSDANWTEFVDETI